MKIGDLPREQIPWYPTIDEEKCTGCGVCVEFCAHGTHELDEAKGKARVANPYHCVVGCTGCESQCPAGAISFPPLSILKDLVEKRGNDGGCDCGCDCGTCR